MSDSHTAEIEAILHGRPSRAAFRLVCSLINTWPDPADRDAILRRVRHDLARWPTPVRHVTVQNCDQLPELMRPPGWTLVRSLELSASTADAEDCARLIAYLAADPTMRRLRRLDLIFPDDALIRALPTIFPNLTRLSIELSGENRRQALIPFLRSGLPPHLRSLTVDRADCLDDFRSDDFPEVIDAIAGSPVGRRLRSIRLPNMSAPTFVHFLDTIHWPLADIGHQQWTDESLDRLCRNRELVSGLKRLDLLARDLGREGIALLVQCPYFGQLEHLNLGNNELGPAELSILAGSPLAPNLRSLRLFSNPLGDDGWRVLGRAPFRRLRTLELCATEGTAAGAGALGRSRALGRLWTLDLSCNRLGDAGLTQIFRARSMLGLRSLNVCATNKSAAAAATLAARPLPRLRALDLGSDQPGPGFGRHLRASNLPALTTLKLNALGLEDEDVEHLARATRFPHLRRLELGSNKLTSRGVHALAASPLLASIRELSLQLNFEIDDEAAAAVAGSPFLKNLVELDLGLGWSKIGPDGLPTLRSAPCARLLVFPEPPEVLNPSAEGQPLEWAQRQLIGLR